MTRPYTPLVAQALMPAAPALVPARSKEAS